MQCQVRVQSRELTVEMDPMASSQNLCATQRDTLLRSNRAEVTPHEFDAFDCLEAMEAKGSAKRLSCKLSKEYSRNSISGQRRR